MSDPFSMVYDALWDLAEASSVIQSLVKPGNRIKLNKEKQPPNIKKQVAASDLPELLLLAQTSEGNIGNTSCSSMIKRQYQFALSTGNLQLTGDLMPVEFALWAALNNHKSVLGALRWPTDDTPDSFCKNMRLISAEAGFSDAERNRGIVGWSALWTLEVEMWFKQADLIAYGAGT